MSQETSIADLVEKGVELAGSARALALASGLNDAGVKRIQRFCKPGKGGTTRLWAEDVDAIRTYLARRTEEQDNSSHNESSILTEDSITYPVAINGHGASFEGRDNDSGYAEARLPVQLVRTMMGGRVPKNGLWTTARGESMTPYIPNGHPVFIELDRDFVDGGRYAVWLGSGTGDVIKRVEVGPEGSIILRSDNRQVSTKTLYPTDDPEVWADADGGTIRMVIRGEVVWPPDTAAAVFSQFVELNRRVKQ